MPFNPHGYNKRTNIHTSTHSISHVTVKWPVSNYIRLAYNRIIKNEGKLSVHRQDDCQQVKIHQKWTAHTKWWNMLSFIWSGGGLIYMVLRASIATIENWIINLITSSNANPYANSIRHNTAATNIFIRVNHIWLEAIRAYYFETFEMWTLLFSII